MKTQLHPGAGVVITDVDLRSLDDATFARIHALFAEHGLLFVRGQSLSEEDHLSFARRFGTINVNRFFPRHARHPEIALVAKEPEQRANVGGGWHTDHSYDVEPALGSILVARELPSSGGDTWFVNMADAFERLPARVKNMLWGMRAVHSSKHVFGTRGALIRRVLGVEQLENPQLADAMEDAVHPVVVTHPLSGRQVLYVNPSFTVRFDGASLATSLPLLLYLYAHALKPKHVAKFRWEPGSIAVWDNRATWHYARNDYAGERRVMHRVTIDGCALEPAHVAPR